MKKYFLIMFFTAVGLLSYAGKVTTIRLSLGETNVQKVALIAHGVYEEKELDANNTVEIQTDDIKTGYAMLRYGNASLKIFVRSGDNLDVAFAFDEVTKRNKAVFKGAMAKENEFMHDSGKMIKPAISGGKTAQEVMDMIDAAVVQNIKTVDDSSLSEEFIKMERERIRYATLLIYNQYMKWNPTIFPYLKEKMVVNDELLAIDEYQKFMKTALSTRGFENMPKYNPYQHADDQLKIVTGEIRKGRVAEYLASTVVCDYMNIRGVDEIGSFDAICKKIVKNKEYKKPYDELHAKWSKVAKGEPCPEFKYEDINGKIVTPADLKGKYVYIDCWATWCGPCMAQVKPLGELEHLYASRNIVFVSMSSDSDKAKWAKTVAQKNMGGIQLFQSNKPDYFTESFMIYGIPRFILLDREGQIIDANMSRPSNPETRVKLESLEGF